MSIVPKSLGKQVKLTFIMTFALFSVVSLGIIFLVSKVVEDYIFEKQLIHFIENYKQQLQDHANPIAHGNFQVHRDKDTVPEELHMLIDDWIPSAGELSNTDQFEYHYVIETMPDGENYLFLFDVSALEISEKLDDVMMQIFIVVFLVLIGLFFILFNFILKHSMQPMFQLIKHVENNTDQPQQWRHDNGLHKQKGEIGLLYKTIANYAQRIEKFISREREFGSFASHELRTPVTVIKGATELLKLQQTPAMKKPLARIEKASDDMEEMIHLLLDLSRENSEVENKLGLANTLLIELINQHRNDSRIKGRKLTFAGTFNPELEVARLPFQIALNNLLQNAIKFSSVDTIQLLVSEYELLIENQIHPAQNQREQGYGLGLIIVERICEQQHWQFSFQLTNEMAYSRIQFA